MNSSNDDDITRLLRLFAEGDASAARSLWSHFFLQVVRAARRKTLHIPQTSVDAEDIAASVFESLWRAANEGRLDGVSNRMELWWLLLRITQQKVVNHVRAAMAQRRGVGRRGVSLSAEGLPSFEDELLDPGPTPDAEIVFQEEYDRLLGMLRDDQLRQIAVMKLCGHTNNEISAQVNVSTATVARKLQLIRETWAGELKQ